MCAPWSPYPYDMCLHDADLYDQDADPSEMTHPECAAIAQHRDDELITWAQRQNEAGTR